MAERYTAALLAADTEPSDSQDTAILERLEESEGQNSSLSGSWNKGHGGALRHPLPETGYGAAGLQREEAGG